MKKIVNNSKENNFSFLWRIVVFIKEYFYTEFIFLSRPTWGASQINKNRNEAVLLNPDLFLLINIVLTYLIFKIPNPIQIDDQFFAILKVIDKPLLYVGVILKYVLAVIIFLIIFHLFSKTCKTNVFNRDVYIPICYASATYIPIAFIKDTFVFLIGDVFINLTTQVFSGLKPTFSYLDVLRVIFYFAIFITLLYWWGWIFFIGVKQRLNYRLKNIGKRVFLSVVTFIIVQNILLWTFLVIKTIPVFETARDLYNAKEIIKESTPNYLKAAFLFEGISKREIMTPSIQYRAKISAIVYKLPTILFDKKDTQEIFLKTSGAIKGRNFEKAEKLLYNFLNKKIAERNNTHKNNYVDLMEELKEATSCRSWKYFTNEEEVTINIFCFFHDSSVPILFP